jgi:uncharacterized membrane protein
MSAPIEQCTTVERRGGRALSLIVRAGLALTLVLLLVGVVLALARPGVGVPDHTSFSAIPGALLRGEAGGFFSLGLLVLILTPVFLILAVTVVFARRRQWLFVAFGVIIMAVLALSAVLGLIG